MSSERYESFARIGQCMICNKQFDLRCGTCFKCNDKVSGKPLANGKGHVLWETNKPENTWIVGNM